jgi:hypothetical protein
MDRCDKEEVFQEISSCNFKPYPHCKYNKHRCRNRRHGGLSQTLCSAATSSIAGLSFTAFIIISQMLLPYSKYVKILKFLTIFLFAYVVTAILAGVNWDIFLFQVLFHFEFTPAFAMIFVAIFWCYDDTL